MVLNGGDGPILAATAQRLMAAGCVAADLEAATLVEAAPDATTLEGWIRRRESGEPPAWITGRARFCGRMLHVVAGVYVPRPHSEELARRAAAALPAGGRALDLCTGSGAVAAHLQARVPTARVLAVDLDARAAACARRNGVAALVGDLAEPIRRAPLIDVLTAVAPYVPTGELRLLPADVQRYEPAVALDGGADGLALVARIIEAAARLLRPGGRLFLELGGDQDRRCASLLAAADLEPVATWHDEDGDLRGVAARRVG